MDEQQVRLLVRQAIARHLAGPTAPLPVAGMAASSAPLAPMKPPPHPGAGSGMHPSAAQFVILRPAGEVDCIIEPSVTCNHCGYCLCYGH